MFYRDILCSYNFTKVFYVSWRRLRFVQALTFVDRGLTMGLLGDDDGLTGVYHGFTMVLPGLPWFCLCVPSFKQGLPGLARISHALSVGHHELSELTMGLLGFVINFWGLHWFCQDSLWFDHSFAGTYRGFIGFTLGFLEFSRVLAGLTVVLSILPRSSLRFSVVAPGFTTALDGFTKVLLLPAFCMGSLLL